jgi:DNA transformation protein and related proteins
MTLRDTPLPDRLIDMQGLGPVTASWLERVGIHCAAELRAADPFEVYVRLKAHVPGVNVIALYAIIGAIEGRHWQDIKRERRAEIVLRLDELGLAPR